MKVLLDVDGVLANLVQGVLDWFGVSWPEDERGDEAYDIQRVLKYRWEPERFWHHFDTRFWATLPGHGEAQAFVSACTARVGVGNVCLSTHPVDSLDCIAGKLSWCKERFPELPVILHTGNGIRKDMLAHPGMVLIDDYSRNVDDFRAAGGNAFLVGRRWNRDWQQEATNVPRLLAYLDSLTEEKEIWGDAL